MTEKYFNTLDGQKEVVRVLEEAQRMALDYMMLLTATYSMSLDGTAFFCRMCGNATKEPNNVERRFCGHCQAWHDNLELEKHLKTTQ